VIASGYVLEQSTSTKAKRKGLGKDRKEGRKERMEGRKEGRKEGTLQKPIAYL